mmetsp:Transcript_13093/g.18750  ORF Transcript_13093/g.18750 Transcript_13093/m.18750 type:complete len:801 (-) Transcript_13093:361-2763(-)
MIRFPALAAISAVAILFLPNEFSNNHPTLLHEHSSLIPKSTLSNHHDNHQHQQQQHSHHPQQQTHQYQNQQKQSIISSLLPMAHAFSPPIFFHKGLKKSRPIITSSNPLSGNNKHGGIIDESSSGSSSSSSSSSNMYNIHYPKNVKHSFRWEPQPTSSSSSQSSHHYFYNAGEKSSRRLMADHQTVTRTEESWSGSGPESSSSDSSSSDVSLPLPDSNGIYIIDDKEQHLALLNSNPDKIVIVKFYAPWCRACKGLEPKFIQIVKDEKYKDLPILFAQLSIQNNKEFVKSLGVVALPSIQMYSGEEGLIETFPCGPSKVPILKRKLAQVVNEKVDPETYELKPYCEDISETTPCIERNIAGTGDSTRLSVGDVTVTHEIMEYLQKDIPYFKDFTEEEFTRLMSKAKYVTFEPGNVIMKQGNVGKSFYVIDSGEVEIIVKGAFEDPLTTPVGYLGTVLNRLSRKNYFGERSLLTGEPRAASIRAAEKTRCIQFRMEDIPESSVLSGKQRPSRDRLRQVNDKYGQDFYNIDLIDKQFTSANVLNQARGSVNKPKPIPGVDIDDEDNEDAYWQQQAQQQQQQLAQLQSQQAASVQSQQQSQQQQQQQQISITNNDNEDMIFSLLHRFKLLRHASQCFDYILKSKITWSDEGEIYRRSLLVSKLSPGQVEEFTQVFHLIDTSNDGLISVLELKRALHAIEDDHTDEQIFQMIDRANPLIDGNTEIGFDEFMGLMAEAEFYYLFKDTFSSLDKSNSGFVQARKIDKILCGLRDLISDDRMSVIDIEDKDMLIDYETFSRMLIGNH